MTKSYDFVSSNHFSPFVRGMYKILRLVVKEEKFFKNNPKALAWTMFQYDQLDRSSRYLDVDEEGNQDVYWGNPKYPIIELEKEVSEDYANLIYDAWGAGVRNSGYVEKKLKAELKINKTVDDYLALFLNSKYRYQSLYESEKDVLDSLLCVIGTGYRWNQDGFLAEIGPSGCDQTIFYNFQLFKKETLPEKILKQLKFLEESPLKEALETYQKIVAKQRREDKGRYSSKVDSKLIDSLFKTDPSLKESFTKAAVKKMSQNEFFKLMMERVEAKLPAKEKAKRKKEQKAKLKKEEEEKKKADNTYYPLSKEYSNLCTMPKNAHPSYIAAGKKVAQHILNSSYETADNKKLAQDFLKKWDKVTKKQ